MRRIADVLGILIATCGCGFGLNPSLDVSQYAHDSWTLREGLFKGNIYAIAQTPDGYLWVGTEFGLWRFDGVRSSPWQPPLGQNLPDKGIHRLLVARDGTLWLGTFNGLASWSRGKLTVHPDVEGLVTSLLEDREGTVWAGAYGQPHGWLCAIRGGKTLCYGKDGAFDGPVASLYEDSSGAIWAGAQPGLWRWKPGPPRRYVTPPRQVSGLTADDGKLLLAMNGAGLMHLAGETVERYPIRAANSAEFLRDRDVNSNLLLRDRDGGLWIGTVGRGLIHVHEGRTDVFTRADGLSGDVVLSLFEDREGNVWVATAGGLDRFREFPVSTVSARQGLSSNLVTSVLAARDGSVWIGAHDGLTRWKNGQTTIFRKASGLPDDSVHSLFQDYRGQIWVSTRNGLARFADGRFIATGPIPSEEVFCIAGDKAGSVWLSGNRGLSRLVEARLIEHFAWPELGRHEQAKIIVPEQGGVWLSFWSDGGVLYFKDRRVRAAYSAADGLGNGHVPGLRLDADGALWAATQDGGLSRLKDGRIATLTTRNGLPCDTIHWTIEDDDRALWLYTGCGLVRIGPAELNSWIADPGRRIEPAVWDASDGVKLRAVAASGYSPTVAKSTDGRIWFVTGEGVQVVDPRHLAVNKIPPPVRVEQVIADSKVHWQNTALAAVAEVRLPPRIRDLRIEYTALSLVAPEKVHFKYKLEGQDQDWREVTNQRQAQYTNLSPGNYRFRVMASNNSGLWNEQGDSLEFAIARAFYQTNWFRALCGAALLALLWAAYQARVRRLRHEINMASEARLNERLRIARELHDTLLQSFQGLLLPLQGAHNLLPGRAPEARKVLETAIDDAARAVTEARHAVEGLRSTPILCGDLVDGIKALGQELAARQQASDGAAPAFSVEVEGQPYRLDPAHRDEIYRVAGEALRNAFLHARARQIEVELRYDANQLRVRVRDDGTGIEPEVLDSDGRTGHWGLKGMRERTKRIGGQLEVWSERGAGTEVQLILPASIAYADDGSRRSWPWKKGRGAHS